MNGTELYISQQKFEGSESKEVTEKLVNFKLHISSYDHSWEYNYSEGSLHNSDVFLPKHCNQKLE